MKNIFSLLFFSFLFVACGSSKPSVSQANNDRQTARHKDLGSSISRKSERKKKRTDNNHVSKEAVKIVENAIKFEGTPYQYGGTTKRGMDCSGLVYVSFQKEGVPIPRTSRAMSLEGKRLKLKEVQTGDLLFFKTNKNRNVINHVGLVVKVSGKEISFIHSTTSLGVIVSTLDQAYWKDAFMMARRLF